MLKAISLGMRFDGDPLFTDLSLTLGPGDRYGLVGPNGAGKSTLLRLLIGAEKPSTGHVERGPGTRLGYFAQQVPDPAGTVGAFLGGELGVLAAETADLARRLADGEDVLAAYGDAQENWERLGGWAAEARIADVRQRLGIAHLPDTRPLGRVSGGEQARLMLARVLLDDPDLLILDEPTNHLDAEGAAWLGEYLAGFRGGVMVISHDRAFLDRVANRVYELDGISEEVQVYQGGYTDYRAEKARRWQRMLADYEIQQKAKAKLEESIAAIKGRSQEVEAANQRNPHLRRIARVLARKAKVREKRLTRQIQSARWIAEPTTRPALTLAFDAAAATGPVLSTTGLGFGDLIRGLDLTVEAGDRLLITGPNGAGKTTLLKLLSGALAPDAGSVSGGDVAVLPQTHDDVRRDVTVMDYFRSHVPVYADDAEALLAAHLFGPDEWDANLRTLSAGELSRLLLAILVNTPGRVLLLDEPTNYLDFEALDVVEEALRAFTGTMILVSHDEYFAAAVGVTRRLALGAAL